MKKLGLFLLLSSFLLISINSFASSDSNVLNRQSVLIQLNQIMADGEFDNSLLYNSTPNNQSFPSLKRTLPMPFIIGGSPVGRNAFPEYTLVILTDGFGNVTGLCGGTVIAPDKVLTAAHCSLNNVSSYFLIPGFYSFNDSLAPNDLIQLSNAVIHPNYSIQDLDFDIAVMTLRSNVTTTPAKVVEGNNQLVGKVGTVIGTGLTATVPAPQTPDVLLGVDTPIISNEECSQAYLRIAGIDPITENMLCAGFENSDEGSCSGDSGGPLFVGDGARRAISGIVSFGFTTCEIQRATSVYSRATAFTDFIKQQSPDTEFANFSVSLTPIYSLLLDDNDTAQAPVAVNPALPRLIDGSFVAAFELERENNVGLLEEYSYSQSNSNIDVSSDAQNTIRIRIQEAGVPAEVPQLGSWTWEMHSSTRERLLPGNYFRASNNLFGEPLDHGISVSRNASPCSVIFGAFFIYEIEYRGSSVTKLTADFRQSCLTSGSRSEIIGSIRFDSTN